MLSSLPLLNKHVLLFVFFSVALLLPVSAFTFGVSPPSLSFDLDPDDTLCENITLSSSVPTTMKLSDLWTSHLGSHAVSEYILSSDSFDLSLSYPSSVLVSRSTSVSICVRGRTSGTYTGLLLASPGGYPEGVGVWMQVTVKGSSLPQKTFVASLFAPLRLTGLTVSDVDIPLISLGVSTFLLGIMLVLLLLLLMRRKRERNQFTY